jgi:hypothetical protein
LTAQPAQSVTTSTGPAVAELDRQLQRLIELGYPALAGRSFESFAALVNPLREQLAGVALAPATTDRVPLVLVVRSPLVATEAAIALQDRDGKPGFISADLADVARFKPIEAVDVPSTDVYVLLDVERGDEYLNWTPDEALPAITERRRTPLTIDEGIAVVTHAPGFLEPNRCFMVIASRCGDRRVPALWISGGTGKDGRDRRGAAKLGWCWAGNRHTWLGHASAARRVSA